MPELENRRYQYAVGQGFFHAGEVAAGAATFQYVYDCGSDNRIPLARAIEAESVRLAQRGSKRVDALFVSHLDRDHVNGMDALLSVVRVETVFLPYLTPYERLALVAGSLEDGPPGGTLLEFAQSPHRWFGSRGASRVVYVLGSLDHEGPVIPPVPEGPPPDLVGGIRLDFEKAHPPGGRFPGSSGRGPEVAFVRDRTPVVLQVGGWSFLNWVLVTFVHPDPGREKEFRQRVSAELNVVVHANIAESRFMQTLVDALRDGTRRRRLARSYADTWGNRNVTSMCLYSGPARLPDDGAAAVTRAQSPWWEDPRLVDVLEFLLRKRFRIGAADRRCGWLGTGDADLLDDARRVAFRHHYGAVMEYVGTLTLPHHGSGRNFHPDLVAMGPEVFVASASTTNRHGHPHADVQSAAMDAGRLVVVTEQGPGYAYEELVALDEP